jgi:hypothetical protein
LLATIENLELVKMRFSAFCAHLNKSYGAKHVMHGGDAETFIGALVFDILDKVFKLSLAKFCGIRVMGRIISKG